MKHAWPGEASYCPEAKYQHELSCHSTQLPFLYRSSAGAFVRAGSISLQDAAQHACHRRGYNSSALTYDCALFARKFPSYTASAAQHLLASCSSGLNITNDGVCDKSAEEIPHQRVSGAHTARRILKDEDVWQQHLISMREHASSQWQELTREQQQASAWLEDRL